MTTATDFPTKSALLEAVLVGRLNRMREQAEVLGDAADAGQAFYGFLAHVVADATGKLAIAEALVDAGGEAAERTVQASYDLR